MTAQELIDLLGSVPPETPVGRIGHFGEFLDLKGYSFRKTVIDGNTVIAIEPPDIGLEPD